jgi:hypothetical protein
LDDLPRDASAGRKSSGPVTYPITAAAGARSNVRTETLRAFTEDEARAIADEL